MQDLINSALAALSPWILEATAGLVAILIARAAMTFRAKFGFDIAQKHQDNLHRAIMTGLSAALARGFTGNRLIAEAITHAKESVPDAINALAPEPQVLARIAESKVAAARAAVKPDPLANPALEDWKAATAN
jgi:hypothetical protein